jgi:hypothetical protein
MEMKGHELDVYAALIGEMTDAYNKAGGKFVMKRLLGRPMGTHEDRHDIRIS